MFQSYSAGSNAHRASAVDLLLPVPPQWVTAVCYRSVSLSRYTCRIHPLCGASSTKHKVQRMAAKATVCSVDTAENMWNCLLPRLHCRDAVARLCTLSAHRGPQIQTSPLLRTCPTRTGEGWSQKFALPVLTCCRNGSATTPASTFVPAGFSSAIVAMVVPNSDNQQLEGGHTELYLHTYSQHKSTLRRPPTFRGA